MALQSDNLVAVGLGVLNEVQPGPQQTPLVKGNHLRYATSRERGFPWYGFHIFRRQSREAKPICCRPPTRKDGIRAGSLTWETPLGIFFCDSGLKTDDSFAPQGQMEFDLRGRAALRFSLPPGRSAVEFRVKLGLYGASSGETPSPPRGNPPGQQTAFGGALSNLFSRLAQIVQRYIPFRPPSVVGPIQITAYDGALTAAHAAASGAPGQVVTATLSANTMDSIAIQPGPWALIEICYTPLHVDATSGWQKLRGFPYPLCLPSATAAYPCAGKPASTALAQAMAKGRVRYGDPNIWDDGRFAEMTVLLNELVYSGPAGGRMCDRQSPDFVVGGATGDPSIPKLYPLDLLGFAALHPSVAQALGTYWVDQTAADGVAYDYFILADHDNSCHGDPNQALAIIAGGNLPANVDGWIVSNLHTAPVAPLAAPGGPLCYALPGSTVASSEAGAVPPPGTNAAGLRWTLPMTQNQELLPGSPVFYHLWRLSLGAAAPAAPPAAAYYTLLTADMPIVVAQADIPTNQTMQRASDWPPFNLFAYDRDLPDGWYSYRLSAVNIFGQFSALSEPAHWHQWAPVPDPRPWYYSGAASDAELNAHAVHLRDTTPPPAPPGVEAYALDPLDPLLTQDTRFTSWLAAGWWNNLAAAQKAARIGVRVSWRWTKSQMLQAPDTNEFRIYFNPTGMLPGPDGRAAVNWSERIHVVPYAGYTSMDQMTGDRIYDVLLPVPPASAPPGVPMAPDNAHPVVYGHIGVSAADDKIDSADDPKWQGTPLGNRNGNEGRLGVPAKIYRVLRDPPPAPGIADPSGKVWATPANYQSESYYTFRWPKPAADAALIDAHVFRAMDETLFEHDFRQRPRQPLDTANPLLFPVPGSEAAIKTELDDLNTLAPLAATDSDADVTLKIRAALPAYRALSDAALRVLASLPADTTPPKPGNDGAFAQVTILPLKHGDAANADRIGPDGKSTYVPDASLCAYLATLDGRARNRYFFRAAFVNAAHAMGPLGPSSPPVYLPKVAVARTPAITKVLGGDRQITISFASNREDDLAEYRIYRADDARTARDIRLMTLVATIPETQSDPVLRAKEQSWTDTNVVPLVPYHYRMTSRDASQNESAPTAEAIGKAYDITPPPPPVWVRLEWVYLDAQDTEHLITDQPPQGAVWKQAVAARWRTPQQSATLLQRHELAHSTWRQPQGWLQPSSFDPVTQTWMFAVYDRSANPLATNIYRIQVEGPSGNLNIAFDERKLQPA